MEGLLGLCPIPSYHVHARVLTFVSSLRELYHNFLLLYFMENNNCFKDMHSFSSSLLPDAIYPSHPVSTTYIAIEVQMVLSLEESSENIQCNSLFLRETQCRRMLVAGAGGGRGCRGVIEVTCLVIAQLLLTSSTVLFLPHAFPHLGYYSSLLFWSPIDYGECRLKSVVQDTMNIIIYRSKRCFVHFSGRIPSESPLLRLLMWALCILCP